MNSNTVLEADVINLRVLEEFRGEMSEWLTLVCNPLIYTALIAGKCDTRL